MEGECFFFFARKGDICCRTALEIIDLAKSKNKKQKKRKGLLSWESSDWNLFVMTMICHWENVANDTTNSFTVSRSDGLEDGVSISSSQSILFSSSSSNG